VIVLVPALAGALVVGGLIALVVGLRPSPIVERPSRPRKVRTVTRQTRMLLLGGLAAGVDAWASVVADERGASGWAACDLLILGYAPGTSGRRNYRILDSSGLPLPRTPGKRSKPKTFRYCCQGTP